MMEKKIMISRLQGRVAAALTEDGKLAELSFCPEEQPYALGDIYVGKISRILPNIHAAFVEIGKQMECYYSLEAKSKPFFTAKGGKKPYCVGDELLVQIQKEAVRTKQPVISGDLNFTGRYAVLTTGSLTIGVSSRIGKEKKAQLTKQAKRYSGRGYGLILRTNAAAVPWETVEEEIQMLEKTCAEVTQYANTRTCFSCVLKAPRPYLSLLRDIYQSDLSEIVVEEGSLFDNVKLYLEKEQPEDIKRLRCYSDPVYPLSKCCDLEHAAEEAMKDRVWLGSGAYLVIQQTEAMHVIDVNSGRCVKKKKETLDMNKEAAAEAARQIRLRNLSGIIMVDFINMDTLQERTELLTFFQKELNRDRNPGRVVDMTKLQITEVTRKKIRKTLKESFYL